VTLEDEMRLEWNRERMEWVEEKRMKDVVAIPW
jgi:hypothetical protein